MINTVHEKLKGYVENGDIAGASIIVRKNGDIVHEEYLGFADIAAKIPVSENTIFRLASMTKPVIAVAIMCMAERGLLSIADPIAKYIPAFAEMHVAAEKLDVLPGCDMDEMMKKAEKMTFVPLKRAITIEDLLRHRSGLGQGIVSITRGINDNVPGIDLVRRVENITEFPMDFQPGEGTGYSAHVGFDILGRIVEIVSGKPLAEILNEIIFEPLGMTDITFWPTDDQKPRIPRFYQRPNGVLEDVYPDDNAASPFNFSYPCGSAGLYATLADYDRFVQMLANGGELDGKRILKTETVKQMAARCADDPETYTWGLGMNVFSCHEKSGRWLTEGTFGWSGAYGTHFYIDPVNNVCMTLMANRADIGGAGSYVSWGVEEAIFKGLEL